MGGSATIPRTRWTARDHWRGGAPTLAVLLGGLSIFGVGQALQVQAGLGNGPWTVLAQGISLHTGLDLGAAVFAIGCAVLLLWIPLRERPGLGTVMNVVIISATLSAGIAVIPRQSEPWLQVLMSLGGIACIGVGSALYLTCGMGPGPRDGWMTAMHRHSGWPVARVRLFLEVGALGLGWLLGGEVGVGTVMFAVLIGRAIALSLGAVGALAPATEAAPPLR